MSNKKLKVNEHHNKENYGLAGNRPSKKLDNFNLLKKSSPVQEFQASDLSSIVSERQLKSREIFDEALSKKSSLRHLIDESSAVQTEIYKQIRKRASIDNQSCQPKKANLALKSMLSEKNAFSEIENLRETNYKLLQENKQLRSKLFQMTQKLETSLTRENTYESKPHTTVNGCSFDSFQKLQESNKVLRSKLDLSKRNQKELVEKYEKQIKELSKDKRNYNQSVDTCNVFSVSSIYSKAFNKARMPEIESFSKAIKNYFQQFQDTFLKINIMFENLQQPEATSQRYLQTKQLVSLLKIPVMYKNKPKVVDSILSINRSGVRPRDNKPILQTFSPELLSAEQTLCLMQQMLNKMLKSNIMLKLCREDKQLMSLIARLRA